MIDILKNGLIEMKEDLKKRNYKKQIANFLTLSRFFSPIVLLPLYYFNKMHLFIIMIIFFCLTDTFDGYFARKYSKLSIFGKYLDAVVDKIFIATLLIPIISNFYYTMIFVMEALITFVNLYAFYKKLNPKTIFIGKVKTYFLFTLVCLIYLKEMVYFNDIYLTIMVISTIMLQLITSISYILEFVNSINKKIIFR